MENLNAEQAIEEIDSKIKFAKFANTDAVILSSKAAQFCLVHAQYYEQKIKELTEENERLRAENETLKVATNDQYAHICDCHDNIAEMLRQKEAYTVMKMHSMLCEGRVSNDNVVIVANQVVKELLEGDTYPAVVKEITDETGE